MPQDPRKWVQVCEWLRSQIDSGSLPSGSVLNIGLIADQRDVSRPTVAHALRELERERMVRRFPGVGWQVT